MYIILCSLEGHSMRVAACAFEKKQEVSDCGVQGLQAMLSACLDPTSQASPGVGESNGADPLHAVGAAQRGGPEGGRRQGALHFAGEEPARHPARRAAHPRQAGVAGSGTAVPVTAGTCWKLPWPRGSLSLLTHLPSLPCFRNCWRPKQSSPSSPRRCALPRMPRIDPCPCESTF